jgi:hypothetical protein
VALIFFTHYIYVYALKFLLSHGCCTACWKTMCTPQPSTSAPVVMLTWCIYMYTTTVGMKQQECEHNICSLKSSFFMRPPPEFPCSFSPTGWNGNKTRVQDLQTWRVLPFKVFFFPCFCFSKSLPSYRLLMICCEWTVFFAEDGWSESDDNWVGWVASFHTVMSESWCSEVLPHLF